MFVQWIRRFAGILFLCATATVALAATNGPKGPGPKGFCLPDDYNSWTADAKASWIWSSRVQATAYAELPPVRSHLLDLRQSFLSVAFDHASDEMPEGRRKLIHGYGAVALVRLSFDKDHPWTGVFRPRADSSPALGLMRASLAGAPGDKSFTPGMALKIFRDGHQSANFFAMNNLSGQTSWNFFEKEFSNIVPEPTSLPLMLVARQFAKVKPDPNKLSSAEAASLDTSGKPELAPRAPAQIWFVPSHELPPTVAGSHDDFRVQLSRIPVGTTLYEIVGSDTEDGPRVRIGRLALVKPFTASQWGDEHLFFRHPR